MMPCGILLIIPHCMMSLDDMPSFPVDLYLVDYFSTYPLNVILNCPVKAQWYKIIYTLK